MRVNKTGVKDGSSLGLIFGIVSLALVMLYSRCDYKTIFYTTDEKTYNTSEV
jgi:hypothetical protein